MGKGLITLCSDQSAGVQRRQFFLWVSHSFIMRYFTKMITHAVSS